MIEHPPTRSPRAAVATSHPLATEAALQLMRRGGTAADAAVGAGAVLTVVEPWASHIGGDAFAIVWDARTGRARAIQGSGAAPQAIDVEAVASNGAIPLRGPLPITVPGMVGAWFHLLEMLGRLPAGEIFAPAIALAEDGFPVGGRWERAGRLHRLLIEADPGLVAMFLRDGDVTPAGTWVRQPDLAETLRELAREGTGHLYRGPLGERIVEDLLARGGPMSRDDLAAHETDERDPLTLDLPGHGEGDCTILEQPPISQGGMVLEILKWLDEADRTEARFDPDTARGIAQEMHAQILAYREARARRDATTAYCDPRFRAREGADTTYLCAVDPEGNAVSWIQSIFHPFGAGYIVPGTGVILNNRMTGFSLDPASPNCLAPGKRTIHTLNTWMTLRGGKPWILGGTPGGERQVQTNVQVLRARLAHSRPLAEALRAPRWGIDERDRVEVEARLPREVRRRLEALGHPVVRVGPWDGSGFVQVIERLDGGGWLACTDPRGEGLAAGF